MNWTFSEVSITTLGTIYMAGWHRHVMMFHHLHCYVLLKSAVSRLNKKRCELNRNKHHRVDSLFKEHFFPQQSPLKQLVPINSAAEPDKQPNAGTKLDARNVNKKLRRRDERWTVEERWVKRSQTGPREPGWNRTAKDRHFMMALKLVCSFKGFVSWYKGYF